MVDAEISRKARELRNQERTDRAARRAYEEGQLAYCLGYPQEANPKRRYHPHWARGWLDARTADRLYRESNAAPLTAAERARGLAAIAAMRAATGLIPQSA